MGFSASQCTRRAGLNLRANWELVPLQWLQTCLVVVLTVLGLIPPLMAVGIGAAELIDSLEGDWAASLEEWVSAPPIALGEILFPLLVALLSTTLIWTVACLAYSFFQGGIFGVLMAGERQSPPRTQAPWQSFRTFSVANFAGWGRKYVWRYFWILNIFLLLFTFWALVLILLAGLTVFGGEQWGWTAGAGIGCGGILPLAFLLVILVFWSYLAQAFLAREESGVRDALVSSLKAVGRRFWALTLLLVILVAFSMALGLAFFFLSLVTDLASDGISVGWFGIRFGLTLMQWFFSGALSVGFGAALVALARGERLGEASE